MINKQKLYFIALMSAAMISMLVSIAGAAPFAYITNQGSNNVSVIDTATNEVIASVNVGDMPLGVVVNPDGTKVYVGNYNDHTFSVIDTATNEVIATEPAGFGPTGIAVSPNGQKLYVAVGGDAGGVNVIDTATNSIIDTVLIGTPPVYLEGVVVTPDGTKVYVANVGNNNVSVIDTATNKVTASVDGLNGPYGVAVTLDGRTVYVANIGNNTVSVIDTATNKVTANVTVGPSPYGVVVTPDGTRVYAANNGDNTVSVIDTATNTVTATVNVGQVPWGVAVTPDGRNVYVANQHDNNVSVINTATNTVIATVNVGYKPVAFGRFIGPMPITPTITWSNPANITYGTALNSTQLDATASVNGTWVYTPPSGTVLSAGSQQTLKTTFTPNNTVNYTTASASVVINVNKATPTITWENATDICHGIPLSYDQLDAAASPAAGTFYYNPDVGTVLSAGQHQPLNVTFVPVDNTNYTTASKTVYINVNQCPEKHGFFHQTEYSTFLPFQWG